jgi:hypothetical protein
MSGRVMMLRTVELEVERGGKITYPAGHLYLVDEELARAWCNAEPPIAEPEFEPEEEVSNG